MIVGIDYYFSMIICDTSYKTGYKNPTICLRLPFIKKICQVIAKRYELRYSDMQWTMPHYTTLDLLFLECFV
jgi:hypothetical protein